MNWVVTSCDSKGYKDMLIPFLASLKEVANWKGNIAIIDLGLQEDHIETLKSLGVYIFPKSNKSQAIVCDRFYSLYDNMNEVDIYAHFDADVWFTANIDELFNSYNGKLVCTVDCNFQSFITGVIPDDKNREKYKKIINDVVQKLKKPLQVGFVCGNKKAFSILYQTQKDLIDNKIAADTYGTDTLAINVAYANHEKDIDVIDVSYNCLPDWRPIKVDTNFFLDKLKIKAIHRTSPYRKDDNWSFAKTYPETYKRWTQNYVSPTFLKVQAKGLEYYIRENTWDHTILYHTNEYSVSKIMNFPPNSAIVDIGAHIGGFTKLVASHYPNVKVYSFEPDPDNYNLLCKNTKDLANVERFNCAIGAITSFGTIEKPALDNTGMNRVKVGDGNVKVISVKDLFDIVKEKEICLLKIDCEGGEWAFFDTINKEQYERVWEIQGELHFDSYSRYYKDQVPQSEDYVRKLLRKKLEKFSVFLELGRTVKAYNQSKFL